MTYKEVIDFIYSQLPVFQRVGKAAYKDNLDNIYALCKILGNPQDNLKTIHVAGTNGKGSICHQLAAILQSAGYKTGLFTSPHLKSFTERIKINGREMPENEVVEFFEQYKEAFESVKPSFFEMTVALAFHFFSKEKVDIAVIEVGMGGRLDSTNIITPEVSIISSISLDHTEFLGKTLVAIAEEKAGIIKNKVPVIVGERTPELMEVFRSKAALLDAKLYDANQNFRFLKVERKFEYQNIHLLPINQQFESNSDLNLDNEIDFKLDLLGSYQRFNLPLVLTSIEILKKNGYQISVEAIDFALANTKKLTGLRGRWDIVNNSPMTILDICHNEDAVQRAVEQLIDMKKSRLIIVWGMVEDKDVDAILNYLPQEADYIFTQANIPRALDVNILQKKALDWGLNGIVIKSPIEALQVAEKMADKESIIFVGGSAFVIAEII